MSKYDRSVQISREEEGAYHRREYEASPSRPKTETYSYTVAKPKLDASSDEDSFEQWTTSKRKVNHKTRQVETRVSRQLLVEDGKVIADSGPQVTTRIKEDNKVEECEKERQPKSKASFEALESAPEGPESTGRVLGEKKEIQRVSREVREENMQYHDERFKELTGQDVHRRAIQAPHELITITDQDSRAPPRGKMVHYSNKGKKYQDTDEILEVAKLAIDGSVTKEVKRTKHHEEFSEDEKPDESGEAEALREAPTVTRSSRRHVDYVNDFDDTATPSASSDDELHHESSVGRPVGGQRPASGGSRRQRHGRDEAFPRYELDPLLNSLRDEDFRPAAGKGARRVELERSDRAHSSDDDRPSGRRQRPAAGSSPPIPRVEVPEEYRVHRQRPSAKSPRDRSFSPASKLSSRSAKSHRHNEEPDRRSAASPAPGANSHAETTKRLQRQSTGGSQRRYYQGRRSSSSSSDSEERPSGRAVRSGDSGPRSARAPDSAPIYAVSSRQRRAQPSPAAGSSPSTGRGRVEKPPSPLQRLARLFAPSAPRSKPVAAAT